jgi:hypothetical protein
MPTITREQWMLAQVLAGAVMACNAPFCADDGEEEAINSDRDYIDNVAAELAERTSIMALEDAISVLEKALELKN